MSAPLDLICFSHLRWDFVYQRPQHLLSRFARTRRVFFIEEPTPLPDGECVPRLDLAVREPGLTVGVPRLPANLPNAARDAILRSMLDELVADANIEACVLWYYTPMALDFSRHLRVGRVTVYDCMDELTAFRGAPPELLLREIELFQRADLVFTGGRSLYEAKRAHHRAVHLFPSSVDVAHFAQARRAQPDPDDQARLPRPRLGFYGVLDERLDSALLTGVADLRPDWPIVLLGPTAKIDASALPTRPNIHYLGPKPYAELPRYLAGWDVALLPFARNAATRFISPTKTPEYLAAGRPVVSTSIPDVVHPYGAAELVRIADDPHTFVLAVEAALAEDAARRLARSDAFLADMSWDSTWAAMDALVSEVAGRAVPHTRSRSAVAA